MGLLVMPFAATVFLIFPSWFPKNLASTTLHNSPTTWKFFSCLNSTVNLPLMSHCDTMTIVDVCIVTFDVDTGERDIVIKLSPYFMMGSIAASFGIPGFAVCTRRSLN